MIPEKKDLDDDPDVKEAKEEDDLNTTEKKPSTPTTEKQVRASWGRVGLGLRLSYIGSWC